MINVERKHREGTREHKIIERSAKYIDLIYSLSLSSKKDIENCQQTQEFREIIRRCPLPVKKGNEHKTTIKVKRRNAAGVEYDADINSDYEKEIPKSIPGFPKGWFVDESEREVSDYIKFMVESALAGPALEAVSNIGLARDRNGFEVIEKLADV